MNTQIQTHEAVISHDEIISCENAKGWRQINGVLKQGVWFIHLKKSSCSHLEYEAPFCNSTRTSHPKSAQRRPQTCKTPGMMGRSGKCPVNWGSLLLMHLTPTILLPASKCSTLSTSAKGYRCGNTLRMFSGTVKTASGCAIPLLMSAAVGPAGSSPAASSAIILSAGTGLLLLLLDEVRAATAFDPMNVFGATTKAFVASGRSTPHKAATIAKHEDGDIV